MSKVRSGYLDISAKRWTPELAEEYLNKECYGLLIGTDGEPPIESLDFLSEVPRLRGLGIWGVVADCSAAAGVTTLQRLVLPVAYRYSFDFFRLTSLRELETPFLPTLNQLGLLCNLRKLAVFEWPKSTRSVALIGKQDSLEFLRLEFRRGADFTFKDFQAGQLKEMLLYDGKMDSAELARFEKVEILRLLGTKIESLEFVKKLPRLRELELSSNGSVAGIEPLRNHPTLESVSIAGRTTFLNGDMSALFAVSELSAFGMERGASHYSHSPDQLRRAINAKR